jgi:hypothetical protein
MYLTRKETNKRIQVYHFTNDGEVPLCDKLIRPDVYRRVHSIGNPSVICANCIAVKRRAAFNRAANQMGAIKEGDV